MWSRGTMALIMEFSTTCKPAGQTQRYSWEDPNMAKHTCLLDNTLSSSAVNILLVSCHESSSINRQGQVTAGCKTRVVCARALCQSYDWTLCLTIIIPFPPHLICGLIISVAALTERFIDNSSGVNGCVCVCACLPLPNCALVCARDDVASGSNISSNLWFISLPAHSITIYTWSSGHLFFFPFFLSCLLSKYLLGTPDTSLRGRSTLNALRALTSKPAAFPPIGVAPSPFVACSRIALNNLCENEWNKYYHWFEVNLRSSETKVNRDITSSTATVFVAFSICCYQAEVHSSSIRQQRHWSFKNQCTLRPNLEGKQLETAVLGGTI